MPAIRIERAHRLGLKRARAVARQWADEAERAHGLRCVLRAEPDGDVYEFERAGVSGCCVASADRFLLEADLDWTFTLLRGAIEREIESQLEAAIADEIAKGGTHHAPKKGAATPGAGKKRATVAATARKRRADGR